MTLLSRLTGGIFFALSYQESIGQFVRRKALYLLPCGAQSQPSRYFP